MKLEKKMCLIGFKVKWKTLESFIKIKQICNFGQQSCEVPFSLTQFISDTSLSALLNSCGREAKDQDIWS